MCNSPRVVVGDIDLVGVYYPAVCCEGYRLVRVIMVRVGG